MGGVGSGRSPGYARRAAAEDALPLDIRRLQRAGALEPGRGCTWQWTVNGHSRSTVGVSAQVGSITLNYRHAPHGRSAESISQHVSLETTACGLGGRRSWFLCPSCGNRIAMLYGAGRLFACRRCSGVVYASQAEAADDRAARRADRIRKRLGWPPGILNGPGVRPKGMHRKTYARLLEAHNEWVALALAGMARRLGLVTSRLE